MAEVFSGDLVVIAFSRYEIDQVKAIFAAADPSLVEDLHNLLEALNVRRP